jgi:hypothetical protein
MKVCFKNPKKYFTQDKFEIIKNFIQFIQKEVSLKDDVLIHFVSNREVPMTTGARFPKHNIFVLSKGRLLADVLRTIGHEWTHEFQHQKMGLKDNEMIKDIGGPEENMANALAGIFVKKFAKEFPESEKLIYGTK